MTIESPKSETASDIHGAGWGDAHLWRRDITDVFGFERGTRYFCRNCRACFVHLYNVQPSIFAAMNVAGISDECRA